MNRFIIEICTTIIIFSLFLAALFGSIALAIQTYELLMETLV